jgi:hypothetical protein
MRSCLFVLLSLVVLRNAIPWQSCFTVSRMAKYEIDTNRNVTVIVWKSSGNFIFVLVMFLWCSGESDGRGTDVVDYSIDSFDSFCINYYYFRWKKPNKPTRTTVTGKACGLD